MTPGDLARVARPDAAPSASGARVCARCNTLRAASDYSGAARPGGRDYLDVCRMCRTALHAAARAQAKRDGTCFVHVATAPTSAAAGAPSTRTATSGAAASSTWSTRRSASRGTRLHEAPAQPRRARRRPTPQDAWPSPPLG